MNTTLILLQLLLAHLLTDFILQPNKLIAHKRKYKAKSWFLYIHVLLAGVLSLVFLQELKWWYAALIISITHLIIDLWKLQRNDSLKYFLIDQGLHLLVIFVIWLHLSNMLPDLIPFIGGVLQDQTFLVIITGYLFIIFPAGFLIGKATARWQDDIAPTHKKESLEAAGRYIGIFERILVLTFILSGNFSAIGFLIAAKSILRFSDKTEAGARKQTEYVLIGTLMSFAITIVTGFLVSHFVF